MKKKKILIISIIAFVLVAIVGLVFLFTKRDKVTTLTILDRQWIESNKNKLIDLEIVTSVPNFNYNGEGLFFDFLEAFEKNVGIEFNRVPLKNNSENTYAFMIVDKALDNDIFIYQDNYAIVSKDAKRFASINELQNVTIGVLSSELEKANMYLSGAINITLKAYDNYEDLFNAVSGQIKAAEVGAAVVLKNYNLDKIVKNDLYINYNLEDYTNDYVLRLGNIDKLNSILKKYYQKWSSENYDKVYQEDFANTYYLFNGIAERERVAFVSKRYSYGFVNEAPYNLLIDDTLNGMNAAILREFAKVANIEISFESFNNRESLLTKFNENKIDFFFNDLNESNYLIDVYNTTSTYDEVIAYVTSVNNNVVINSVYSLLPYKVKTIKNSRISGYLQSKGIEVKEYNNMEDLLSSMDSSSLAAINKDTYNYYVHSTLNKYRIAYEETASFDYYFTIRNISDNEEFIKFFNYYLSFMNEKTKLNTSFSKLLVTKSKKIIILNIIIYVLAAIGVITFIRRFMNLILIRRRKKEKLTKEHKLKYVDMLTSLKNRNYLNDNIEKWDASEVYPQTIVVIDLNNVAYINDNYGHQEGDSVIKEAANVLIKTQISNTEIIRTNGNEFVIYMVGYDEKQVISYIRKLNKEFKELAHGFGAAIGYSIISDAIKTVDDAINEATLDMRNNKEELQN